MISAVNSKIIIGTIVIGAFIFLFDVIFDSVTWVFYMSFEIIEFSLDQLVEYIFQTEHHESEIIGLYIFLIIAFAILYRIIRRIPKFFSHRKKKLSSFRQAIQTSTSLYWHELTVLEKMKLILVTTTCITTLLLFLTL